MTHMESRGKPLGQVINDLTNFPMQFTPTSTKTRFWHGLLNLPTPKGNQETPPPKGPIPKREGELTKGRLKTFHYHDS